MVNFNVFTIVATSILWILCRNNAWIQTSKLPATPGRDNTSSKHVSNILPRTTYNMFQNAVDKQIERETSESNLVRSAFSNEVAPRPLPGPVRFWLHQASHMIPNNVCSFVVKLFVSKQARLERFWRCWSGRLAEHDLDPTVLKSPRNSKWDKQSLLRL